MRFSASLPDARVGHTDATASLDDALNLFDELRGRRRRCVPDADLILWQIARHFLMILRHEQERRP
jgi:hypothetical protein